MSVSKRIPKNSIIVITKFVSRDQVMEVLEDPEFLEAYSKMSARCVILGGKTEISKSF